MSPAVQAEISPSCRQICKHEGMIRTQVQLTDEQAEALRRRSRRENVSVAELVRRAIDAFTRGEPPSDRELRDRAASAAGAGRQAGRQGARFLRQ